ncbi:MAG: hypothetical protein IK132_06080 [Clostridia bacterium]|nr:hypothetical protein [Clostridia bacterium]
MPLIQRPGSIIWSLSRFLSSSEVPFQMIIPSRKLQNEILKWSKTNSPILCLILSMDGKWGGTAENAENISRSFQKFWPAARYFIVTQARMNAKGLVRMSALSIPFPSPEIHRRYGRQIIDDFITLIFGINRFFDDAEEYAAMESFSRDMLNLFEWDEQANRDIWTGSMLYAIDRQERFDEAYRLYQSFDEKGEHTASIYSMSLLQRCDTERASLVLEPF